MRSALRACLTGALLLLGLFPLSAQIRTESKDSLVRLMSAESAQMVVERGVSYRKVFGPARFMHNDTYLICDTAWWNVDRGLIKASGHVKILQDETELTGDYLDYIINENLAQFRGGVVQLKDKDMNTLRTSYLDYNTKDSVAVFDHGGAMKDKEGQVIESIRGTYDARIKRFSFEREVNMYSDSIFVKTSTLEYATPDSRATFGFNTNAWNDDNMLSADGGWYRRAEELFFFNRRVHIMTDTQEGWCDSLYFHRLSRDADMLGHAEIADTSRQVVALAGHIAYSDSLSRIELTRAPAIRALSEEDGRVDSTYIAADLIRYQGVPRCLLDSMEVVHAGERLSDILSDPVQEYRRKAAEAARKAREEAQAQEDERNGVPRSKNAEKPSSGAGGFPLPEERAGGSKPEPLVANVRDSLSRPEGDSLLQGSLDSLARDAMDSLAVAGLDSLGVAARDSLDLAEAPEPQDSTRVGFVTAVGRVKVFRRDMQMLCDSLAFTELDSIARLYREPVVFNEGNRQYSADSIAVLVRGQAIDRASLMSSAFIAVEEDSLHYDQIKSTEMLAHFSPGGGLSRFDALGGVNALFYLEEKDALATVNAVDTKMMSAVFEQGTLDRIYYYESVKNDAYPSVQLPPDQRELKGFRWRDTERPKSYQDLMPTEPRASERRNYESRPRARFTYTEKYFPGYMSEVNKKLEQEKIRRAEQHRLRHEQEQREADSLSALALTLPDSLERAVSLADSLKAGDETYREPALRDSLSFSEPQDSLAAGVSTPGEETTPESPSSEDRKAAAQAEKERIRAQKQAAREAHWAYLDSLDQAKMAAKQAKKQEKIYRHNEKIRRKEQRRLAKEQRLYERYLERYRKQKAKQEARAQKAEASRSGRDAADAAESIAPPSDE